MQYDAHVDAFRDEQPVHFAKAKTVHHLIKLAADSARREGIEQGMREKTSLDLRDSHDARSAVHIISAKSRRALSRMVAERNGHVDTGCGHDCSGRVCGRSCELLRAYRMHGEWHGVVVSTVYYDV